MGSIANKLVKYIRNPRRLYLLATAKGLTRWVPDETHLKICFRASVGYPLNLDDPQTFNEKLQWLKLHDRNPLYNTLVDKYRVKEWVAERIGSEYVTSVYGVWESVDDIDLDALPERFVLKTNHDCGGIAICRDKATFDFEAAKKLLRKHFNTNYYWGCREWPYKDVKPLVFAEEYLDPDGGMAATGASDLVDYKFYCFGGSAQCVLACTGRGGDLRMDFFDLEWNHLPFTRHYPNAEKTPGAPARLAEMRSAAERLAGGLPFVRADFYEVGERCYFGEMTFHPAGGFGAFDPSEWDERLGSLLELPAGGGWLLMTDDSVLWFHAAGEEGEDVPASQSKASAPDMVDYKFMCYGGQVRCVFTCTSRAAGDLRVDFFDRDWNHLPFTRHYPNAEVPPAAPRGLRRMVEASEKLSAGIPFVRVDFYEVGGRAYFGEMTFFPGGGFEEFDPVEWDARLGEWLELPSEQG